MEKVKEAIYKNLGVKSYYIFFNKWSEKEPVYLDQVLDHLLVGKTGPQIATIFNRGEQTFNRAVKKLIPNTRLSGGSSWSRYFWNISGYRKCNKCGDILKLLDFNEDRYECKPCQSNKFKNWYIKNKSHVIDRVSLRKALKLKAIPKWADLKEIRNIYINCPPGYHVDHIIPLQGETVCGLHVESNLQYLTPRENIKKSNKFK